MSLFSRVFKNFTKPVYNKGSHYVKYLVCLQEFGAEGSHTGQGAQNITKFSENHGLNEDQFLGLSDILGGNINTVKQISGSAFNEYQSHLDYKLRNIGFASGEDLEDTWNTINEKYGDIHEVITPSKQRLEIMKELASIFVREGKVTGDYSSIGKDKVNSIISQLEKYQQRILSTVEDEEEVQAYQQVFSQIEHQLEENPTLFMVDVVSWLDGAFTNSGLEGVVKATTGSQISKAAEAQGQVSTTTTADIETTQNFLAELNSQIGAPLRRYTEDDEGRTLLVDNEENMPYVSPIPKYLLGGFGAFYGYTVLMGTAPLSLIFGGPVAGYYLYQHVVKNESANVRAVSHIYSRGPEGAQVLDFVVQQNQETVEVVEDVPTEEVQMISSPGAQVSYNNKNMTLSEARKEGLSPIYDVISVRGTNYFIPSSYSANTALLGETGIGA